MYTELEKPTFQEELKELLNTHSMESDSNTPDFILASYLRDCLTLFNEAVIERDEWYAKYPNTKGRKNQHQENVSFEDCID